MNKLLLPVACAFLLAACNEKPGYKISGTVSKADLNGKYVYLYEYGIPNAAPKDSALVEKGSFTLKGVQETPVLCYLQLKGTEDEMAPVGQNVPFSVVFTLENGKLVATLDTISTVTGTPDNDAQTKLFEEIRPMNLEMRAFYQDFESQDETVVKAAEQKIDSIQSLIIEKITDYILTNTNRLSAAKNLRDFCYVISEEKQNEIIEKADSLFKSAPGIGKIAERLEVLKNVAIGKKFVDFEMADTKGKTHTLSDFLGKGKIVLIDFWASWCPPCRREMPDLVALHKKYKNKGFDIIGISLDNKAEAWEKGIKDLQITWPQLSDLKGWANSGAALYGVNSIPHTVLVDKDGTIVAKNLHGKELEDKLKELLQKR